MIIEIEAAVFEEQMAHQDIDRIVYKIEDGWHVWDTEPHENFDAIAQSTWAQESARTTRIAKELFIAATTRSAWGFGPHTRRIRVALEPRSDDELTPTDARALAEQKLRLLVENRDGDGAFISRIVNELDAPLAKYFGDLSSTECPVDIDSLGGKGQMKSHVEAVSIRPFRPRLVVVADSDRTGPQQSPDTAGQRLQHACEQRGIACWILQKREAENYLPQELLEAKEHADCAHQRRVDAWSKLSDEQKDYYDMKNGLPAEVEDVDGDLTAEQALFSSIGVADRAVLESGFGPKIDACWTLWPRGKNIGRALERRGGQEFRSGLALIRCEV
jgi:hypothetical protein